MNKKELESIVQSEISSRRLAATLVARKNLETALENKDFAKSFYKIKTLELKLGKAKEEGSPTKQIEKTITEEKETLKEIIKNLNLSLIPPYSCKQCKDTGVANNAKCKCYNEIRTKILIEQSGFNKTQLANFSDFNENIGKTPEQIKFLHDFKEKLLKLADTFTEDPRKLILFSGKTGLGKTFAAECFAYAAMEKGNSVLYLSSFEFANLIVKLHTTDITEKRSAESTLLSPDLLVIDDLGAEPHFNNVSNEYLHLITSIRPKLAKTTLITSNLDIVGIGIKYSQRTASRLTDSKTCIKLLFPGKDLRV